jgi:hypothetical protein
MRIHNNRIYRGDGTPTGEYVCDICRCRCSTTRAYEILDDTAQLCYDCFDELETLKDRSNEYYEDEFYKIMYREYLNCFITAEGFASYYNISECVAELVINRGRALTNV